MLSTANRALESDALVVNNLLVECDPGKGLVELGPRRVLLFPPCARPRSVAMLPTKTSHAMI